MRTLYLILGVEQDVDSGAIKKAWRGISKENHPDFATARGWTEAEAQRREVTFKEAGAAYAVLGDAAKRAEYDRELNSIRASFLRRKWSERSERSRQTGSAGRTTRQETPRWHRPRYKRPPAAEWGLNVEEVAAQVAQAALESRKAEKRRRLLQAREDHRPQTMRQAVAEQTDRILREMLINKLDDALKDLDF